MHWIFIELSNFFQLFLKIYDDNEDDGINSVSSDVTGGKQYTG